ncbi:hypothetical protein CYMTET_26787 [Cymbomonas tetramitiformis]|uniref:Uncharacterized protein n=1 Tax=Cymbomonas tetramitiformis TaxID=36881 RepID=A0AAE0FR22_9CHLO|nr:hypothetical protein CYMTET_26787 [Cymbomonas tetramitiformis]
MPRISAAARNQARIAASRKPVASDNSALRTQSGKRGRRRPRLKKYKVLTDIYDEIGRLRRLARNRTIARELHTLALLHAHLQWFKQRRARFLWVGVIFLWLVFCVVVNLVQRGNVPVQYQVYTSLHNTFPLEAIAEDSAKSSEVLVSFSEASAWLSGTIEEVWKPIVCGNNRCEQPFERPHFRGAPGFLSMCQSDCGWADTLYEILVVLTVDFAGSSLGEGVADVLRLSASWNLCLRDEKRAEAGLESECWYKKPQSFKTTSGEFVEQYFVVEGRWGIRVEGDYYGLVQGKVLDIQNASAPVELPLSPSWNPCSPTPASLGERNPPSSRRCKLRGRAHEDASPVLGGRFGA